jgi:hypothetical protein
MNKTYDCKPEIIAFLEGKRVRAREYNSVYKTTWPYCVTKLADFDDPDVVFRIFGEEE